MGKVGGVEGGSHTPGCARRDHANQVAITTKMTRFECRMGGGQCHQSPGGQQARRTAHRPEPSVFQTAGTRQPIRSSAVVPHHTSTGRDGAWAASTAAVRHASTHRCVAAAVEPERADGFACVELQGDLFRRDLNGPHREQVGDRSQPAAANLHTKNRVRGDCHRHIHADGRGPLKSQPAGG